MKRLLSALKGIGCIVAGAITRPVNYFKNHITSSTGVDEGIYVPLCGQEQYLLIRGKNTNNPIIIWLHGGPSDPDAATNYAFQKYLVADYTIVNWDQRGCGRTYFRNRSEDPDNKTATFDQALADLDELVAYVCDRFGKEKVILIGHSYGTMPGSKYALEHPDKVLAYVGVGQVVSFESETYSYQDALEKAKANGDDTAEMEAAYKAYMADRNLANIGLLRSKTGKYHTAPKKTNLFWSRIASPYWSSADAQWRRKQAGNPEDYFALNRQLFDYVITADVRNYGTQYQIPVGFISGACDWITPVKYAQDYFDLISAPQKQIHLLDGCGHFPQYASPEEFCKILKGTLNTFLS